MKVSITKPINIQLGDLVSYHDQNCLVIYDKFCEIYNYRLLNLNTNAIVNGYKTIEALSNECILISKCDCMELKIENEQM